MAPTSPFVTLITDQRVFQRRLRGPPQQNLHCTTGSAVQIQYYLYWAVLFVGFLSETSFTPSRRPLNITSANIRQAFIPPPVVLSFIALTCFCVGVFCVLLTSSPVHQQQMKRNSPVWVWHMHDLQRRSSSFSSLCCEGSLPEWTDCVEVTPQGAPPPPTQPEQVVINYGFQRKNVFVCPLMFTGSVTERRPTSEKVWGLWTSCISLLPAFRSQACRDPTPAPEQMHVIDFI